jgi:hypothetical protein
VAIRADARASNPWAFAFTVRNAVCGPYTGFPRGSRSARSPQRRSGGHSIFEQLRGWSAAVGGTDSVNRSPPPSLTQLMVLVYSGSRIPSHAVIAIGSSLFQVTTCILRQ